MDSIDSAHNILITTHVSPDGDAIGSSLALYHFIKNKGKRVRLVGPNSFPYFLRWMDGIKEIEIFEYNPNAGRHQEFSLQKLLDEKPEHLMFNGTMNALTHDHKLKAKVGETVRIFFGVGGPNLTSSFYVIGEIFDRVYNQGSLTSPPLTDVQTTLVPPGGATMVEFKLDVPGNYILVDHALSRAEKGLAGILEVSGEENHEIFYSKEPVDPNSGH